MPFNSCPAKPDNTRPDIVRQKLYSAYNNTRALHMHETR